MVSTERSNVLWWPSNFLIKFKRRQSEQIKRQSGGESPGLVVMGDDSCLRGHRFESWCHILDGHDIFHIDLFA